MPKEPRHTIQVKNGLRWYTVKTYPFSEDYRLPKKLAEVICRRHHKAARVLTMPANVLCDQFNPGEFSDP
jgi:hypothetical protein